MGRGESSQQGSGLKPKVFGPLAVSFCLQSFFSEEAAVPPALCKAGVRGEHDVRPGVAVLPCLGCCAAAWEAKACRALQSFASAGMHAWADSWLQGCGGDCLPSALPPCTTLLPRSGAPLEESMRAPPAPERSLSQCWDSWWGVSSFAALMRTRRPTVGLWMLFIACSDSSCNENVREAVVGCVLLEPDILARPGKACHCLGPSAP